MTDIELSSEDILLIRNALNETLHGLEPGEIDPTLSARRTQAEYLFTMLTPTSNALSSASREVAIMALRNVAAAIDDPELSTRIGFSRDELDGLVERLSQAR